MLTELSLENLAIFPEADLQFAPGLNVVSGETGAGKTVFLRALQLVLGAKADRDLIGSFAEDAYVEAAFDKNLQLFAELTDDDLVLARRLTQGSSRAFVNGRSCSSDALREGAEELILLTGQHAAQRLASAAYQRDLLDLYAGLERDKLTEAYRLWQEKSSQLKDLQKKLLELEERAEFLRHEQELISSLAPEEGEEERLQEERGRLLHAAQLKEEVFRSYRLLSSDKGALDKISEAKARIEEVGEHDPNLSHLLQLLENSEDVAREAADTARLASEGYVADPERLEEIEERLSALLDLRRRYKNLSIEDIVKRSEEMAQEIDLLRDGEEKLNALTEEVRKGEEDYKKIAKKISAQRAKAAGDFSLEVEKHLLDLALSARLHISLHPSEPSALGLETVEILLEANKSMKPAPLHKGASGGELSRLNLAIVLSLPRSEDVTYVFDEVDAGVGGKTAHLLGDKLLELSRSTQVIVVTHLAQIAVLADRHFHIEKDKQGRASILQIDGNERSKEITRLLGLHEDAASEAEEMLRAARG